MVLSKGRGQTNRCQLDLDLSYGGDKDKDKDNETVERIGLSENLKSDCRSITSHHAFQLLYWKAKILTLIMINSQH